MYKEFFLIVENKVLNDEQKVVIDYINKNYNINPKIKLYNKSYKKLDNNLYMLFLSDTHIKEFFQNHLYKDINIAILPNVMCQNAIDSYGISNNINEAIEDAVNSELLSKVDILNCNENLAFNRIEIGNMHGISCCSNLNFISRTKAFFQNLKNIKFTSFNFTTSKEHTFQTVASGITILEHSIKNNSLAFRDEFSGHDGKMNAFVLSPVSLLSYFWYLISIFFYEKISLISLPKSLGFIKTSKLTITLDEEINYVIDSESLYQSKEIKLEVMKDSLNIHLGRALLEKVRKEEETLEEKDTIKVNMLPKGEVKEYLITSSLPLFKKASDDDIKELFTNLRDSAKFSYIYSTLMILSTLLATTGLFASSAPVIIGAMVLAPLMTPIISLSMGVIRANEILIKNSIKTLFLGIFMALFVSSIFTLFIPLKEITVEMQSRLNPNILDLLVAIFSGIAGAYATSKEEVAKSLAGVAIAVALVPPLSVTGIGIGLGSLDVIYGSFLLFITNLVGITLSAALTFLVLGYAPIKRAKKGLFLTLIIMSIITIPLFFSFTHIVEKNSYLKQLSSIKYFILDDKNIEINIINISKNDGLVIIDMEVISSNVISKTDYNILKEKIENTLNQNVLLKITPKIVVE